MIWATISLVVFIILAFDTYKEKSWELWFVTALVSIVFPFGILLIYLRKVNIDE